MTTLDPDQQTDGVEPRARGRESAERTGRPRRGTSSARWFAVGIAVCILSGVAGWAIGRPSPETFNTVDVGFLDDMVRHHQGALALSFGYLGREHDPLVGHFAREIATTQATEIGALNNLLESAGPHDSVGDGIAMDWMGEAVPSRNMPGMATQADLDALAASTGLDADDRFTRLMIAHHAGGVAMAEFAAQAGENDKVKRFAATMARVQRTEVNEMNQRRVLLGLAPVEPDFAGTHAHAG